MSEIEDTTVAQIAASKPNAVDVLHKYQIDYCCGGDLSFKEACTRAGADATKVLNEIQVNSSAGTIDFSKWSPGLLVDYIIEQHHSYVKSTIPVLKELIAKLCDVHGIQHPELYSISEKFNVLADELSHHLLKEEQILFPRIKNGNKDFPFAQPIQVMLAEHDAAGDIIKEIRALTCNYTLPENVCLTYRMTYQKLMEFEKDLMQHIHLENNILFKKIV